jgi:hypothetical protein
VSIVWVVITLVAAGLAVFIVAALAIGREARRLDAVAPRAVYDIEEAVDFVAGRLPVYAAGQLTHDELRQLLKFHMTQLRHHGLQPPKAVDQVQDIGEPVVVEEDGAVGYLIGRAEQAGMRIPDEAVVAVIDAHFDYFEAIGAVGPEADDPDIKVIEGKPAPKALPREHRQDS